VEVSSLLNELPIHPQRGVGNFRSPDAVVMKLANFRALDPHSPSAGLDAGSRLDTEVWDDFADDPSGLRRLAEGIRSVGVSARGPAEDEEGVPEGRLLFRLHRTRERGSPGLVRRKKGAVLRAAETLACEACGLEPIACTAIEAFGSSSAITCYRSPITGSARRDFAISRSSAPIATGRSMHIARG